MTFQQIHDFSESVKFQYPDYAINPEAVELVVTHPDYSHNTIRQSWEANNIYFHCEGSPTGVTHCITFDKKMLEHINSPLDIAINNR